jgi:hypothetical protein
MPANKAPSAQRGMRSGAIVEHYATARVKTINTTLQETAP